MGRGCRKKEGSTEGILIYRDDANDARTADEYEHVAMAEAVKEEKEIVLRRAICYRLNFIKLELTPN